MKKISIAPKLKELEIYKSIDFPIANYKVTSIRATIQSLCTDNPDLRFTTKKNKVTKVIEVTRIA